MLQSYNTIYKAGVGEFVMKKSKFIAYISPVETEEEALAFIEDIRKKHYDATHNCTAYRIGTVNVTERCNDDGEPSRTAGKPMLDVLANQNITNVVLVVTRYFGGTLLGTGGLVKAYQSATIEGLNNSVIITKNLGLSLDVETDYNTFGKIQYYAANNNYHILSTDYSDIVKANILIPPDDFNSFNKKLSELSSGLAKVYEKEKIYYALINNIVELFP